MSLKKSVYVPRFDSQLSHSQRDEAVSFSLVSMSQTPAATGRLGKRPRPVKKTGLVLTVKLPHGGKQSCDKKSSSTGPRRAKVHPRETVAVRTREESENVGGGQGSEADGEKDAYTFSPDKQSTDERDKVKMAVLKNIARMLAENEQIRQRLMSLSQINCSHTKL